LFNIGQEKDEWSGFADLLAGLIEKYAAVLDIESLPDLPTKFDMDETCEKNKEDAIVY